MNTTFFSRNMSLWLRLNLTCAALTLCIFAGWGFYFASTQEKLVEQGIAELGHALADNISAAVSTPILENRIDQIDAILLRQMARKTLTGLVITDANGKVLSSARRNADGKGVLAQSGKQIDWFLPSHSMATRSDGQWHYWQEIVRGKRIGLLQLNFSLADVARMKQQIYVDTLYAAMFTLLMGWFLLYLLLRRPVLALTTAIDFAGQIGQQAGLQLTVDSQLAPLRNLQQSLNTLSSALAQQQAHLNESRAHQLDAALAAPRHAQALEKVAQDLAFQQWVQEQMRQREMETAVAIRRALLWDTPPATSGNLQLATLGAASGEMDGDFFACTRISDTTFEILVGNVMGNDVAAALTAATLKNTYRQIQLQLLLQSRTDPLPGPAQIVNAIHHALSADLLTCSTLLTLALYRLDLQGHTLTYVNAGHTPGLLTDAGGGKSQLLSVENLALGMQFEPHYQQICIPFAAGQLLFTCSQDISTTSDVHGEAFGQQRVTQTITDSQKLPPAQILLRLQRELREFAAPNQLPAQSTAVLLKLPCRQRPTSSPQLGRMLASAEPVCFELDWDLHALAMLRSKIHALANAVEMPADRRDGLLLAALEAASKIIRHTPRQFRDSSISCRLIHCHHALEVELTYVGNVVIPTPQGKPEMGTQNGDSFDASTAPPAVDRVLYSTPLAGVGVIRLIQALRHKKRKKHFTTCNGK